MDKLSDRTSTNINTSENDLFILYNVNENDANAVHIHLKENNNNLNNNNNNNDEKLDCNCLAQQQGEVYPAQQHQDTMIQSIGNMAQGILLAKSTKNVSNVFDENEKNINNDGVVVNNDVDDGNDVDDDDDEDDEGNDEKSHNNSTDNLSFISEDGNNGIIGDIILLPNNLLSEDELSTNSDDCVYAYRGVDFEPIRVSPEDENDFLEMDFEPDPASEIEQDNILLNYSNNCHNPTSPTIYEHSNMDNNKSIPNLHTENMSSELKSQTKLIAEKLEQSQNNKDKKQENVPINVAGNESNKNKCSDLNIASSSSCDKLNCRIKNEEITNSAIEQNVGDMLSSSNQISEDKENSTNGILLSSISYDTNLKLSTKKYTGTIPKTNRFYLNMRSSRLKTAAFGTSTLVPSNDKCNECPESNRTSAYDLWPDNDNNHTSKRWKITENLITAKISYNNSKQLHNPCVSDFTIKSFQRTSNNTKRSMSFPFEEVLPKTEHNNDTPNCIISDGTKLHSAFSQNYLYSGKNDLPTKIDGSGEHSINDVNKSVTSSSGMASESSVTIFSINCTEDIIVEALVSTSNKNNALYI